MANERVKNIKAILFDMGGTLKKPFQKTQDENRLREGVERILNLAGIENVDRETVTKYRDLLIERYYSYRKWASDTLRELHEEKFWTEWMLPEFDREIIKKHAIELNEIFKDMIGDSELRDEAVPVIKELHRRGLKLGIVSNTFSSTGTPKLLKDLDIEGYFDVVVLSAQHGIRKPDPAMIKTALEKLNCEPKECAFVGDKMDRDMLAAKRAGLALSVLIVNPKKHVSLNDNLNEFSDSKPDYVIKDLRELLEIFL